ncbi:FG-GAP repeat domain-containing protein [Planctomycetota bacterium]
MKEYSNRSNMHIMERPVILLLALFITTTAAAEVSFRPPKDIAGGAVLGLSSMDAGDIDNDGFIDVVAVEGGKHASGRKTFAWFKAPVDTQGTWQRFDVNPGAPLRSFLGTAKLADMDGDGDLDLIVSSDNHSGGKMEADVYIFINPKPNGQASDTWNWHRANNTSLPYHHINDMEIADMDGDGKLDIVVRSLQPNQIHIFFQNSISSYIRKSIDTDINLSEGLAVGHIDTDGLADITYTGYWLQSPANPRTQHYTKKPIDPNYKNVNQNTKEVIGDIDGDGRLDVVIAPAEAFRKGGKHDLAWYCNPGGNCDSPWKKTVIKAKTNNHHTVKLGDMDNDNDLDVIVGIPWDPKRVQIYYNNGSGSFGKTHTIQSGKGLYSGVVADLGNDGDLDIIGQDTYARESKPWIYESLLVDKSGGLKPSASLNK